MVSRANGAAMNVPTNMILAIGSLWVLVLYFGFKLGVLFFCLMVLATWFVRDVWHCFFCWRFFDED